VTFGENRGIVVFSNYITSDFILIVAVIYAVTMFTEERRKGLTMFENMKQVSASKVINDRYARETKQAKAKVEKLTTQVAEAQSEVETYKAEVGKCLRGTSKWDADLLRELLDEAQVKLSERQSRLDEAQIALDDCTARMTQIKLQHKELVSCSKIFAQSSPGAKKMILSKLIERIEVGRDYELNICFRISYTQFCGAAEKENVSDKTTAP